MILTIPEPSLILLIGASGCGKSTFARRHFRPTEILSSDEFRARVSDDETDQSASRDAFEILYLIAAKRLARNRLTVVDATNVQTEARRPLLAMAFRHETPAVAIVLNIPEQMCIDRDRLRPDRLVGPNVIRTQCLNLQQSLPNLKAEGFLETFILDPGTIDRVEFQRRKP